MVPLLPAENTNVVAPPQVDVPVHVPTNLAASFPLLVFVHDDTAIIVKDKIAANAIN